MSPAALGASEAAAAQRVDVRAMSAGGRGVARLADGRACFVPLAAPGDVLDIAITRERGRWTEGRILRVVDAGEARRTAPCPHYARCGGCALQHLEYGAQLGAKADIVADALRRIGGWDVEVGEAVGSPLEWRYRNRVTFTLRRLAGGRVVAGFFGRETRGRVVDIDDRCLLPEESLTAAWGALRAGWGAGARRLPAGRELRLTLRSAPRGGVVLVIEGGAGAGEGAALAERVPGLVAIWHRPRGADRPRPLFSTAAADEDAGFEGANAFTQVNPSAAALLAADVAARVRATPGARVVEAYAGDGPHARAAARAGAEAVAIERDPAAVERGRRLGPAVDFRTGDVEIRLPGALPADVLVLNPPRAGMSGDATRILLDGGAARLVYVSCDPATLARDVARLSGAFRPVAVRAFDLFPQTAHVETVVELCATT